MIIRPDNIAIDKDIINGIRSELASINNREDFLNELIQSRLQKCSKTYLDNIDKRIDRLINDIDESDINDIMRAINLVNRRYSDLYRSQVSLYKILQNLL